MGLTDGNGRFLENTTVHFSCGAGDALLGSSMANCQSSGTWSHDFPKCEGSSDDILFSHFGFIRLVTMNKNSVRRGEELLTVNM